MVAAGGTENGKANKQRTIARKENRGALTATGGGHEG